MNVTPLVDVLLVLLIIFMIIVPVRSTGLEARVPQQQSTVETAPDPATVVLRIRGDRSLEINTHSVSWDDLPGRLRLIYAQRPKGVLFVAAAPQVEFHEVARAIDTARGAGIMQIGLMR